MKLLSDIACYSYFPIKDLDALVIDISNSLSVKNLCHIYLTSSKGIFISLECLAFAFCKPCNFMFKVGHLILHGKVV